MGNEIGTPLRGQLSIELIVEEGDIHLKVSGAGALDGVVRYFSQQREVEEITVGEIERETFLIEQYKFVIDAEVEENNIVNLLENDISSSEYNSDDDSSNSSNEDSSYNRRERNSDSGDDSEDNQIY